MVLREREVGDIVVRLEVVEAPFDLCEPFYRVSVTLKSGTEMSYDTVDKENALWQYESFSDRATEEALLATGYLP